MPSFVFVLEKGTVTVWDERKFCYINSTLLAMGEFKGHNLPPWMWGCSSHHWAPDTAIEAASKAFWLSWQLMVVKQIVGWPTRRGEEVCAPLPHLQWVSSFLMPFSAGDVLGWNCLKKALKGLLVTTLHFPSLGKAEHWSTNPCGSWLTQRH